MNTSIHRLAGTAAAAAAAVAVSAAFCSGCESAESYAISVKPGDARVSSAAPSVALTASGWSDYEWSLSDTSLGYLSASKGNSVVYTARSGTFSGGRQTVTVLAVGSGPSTATNSASGGYSAQASITHADETVSDTGDSGSSTSPSDPSGTTDPTTPSGSTNSSGTANTTDPTTPSGSTNETKTLSVAIDPTKRTVSKAGEDFWIGVVNPVVGVTYSWKASTGTLSRTSGPNTLYTAPKKVSRGKTATVTCTATRKGYVSAKTVCYVLFDIPAATNSPAAK